MESAVTDTIAAFKTDHIDDTSLAVQYACALTDIKITQAILNQTVSFNLALHRDNVFPSEKELYKHRRKKDFERLVATLSLQPGSYSALIVEMNRLNARFRQRNRQAVLKRMAQASEPEVSTPKISKKASMKSKKCAPRRGNTKTKRS